MTSGMRVRICARLDKYKNYDLLDKTGTIVTKYRNNFGIKVDDIFNKSSIPGLFYFRESQLIPLNDDGIKEENIMTINTTNITGYTQAIRIKFIDDTMPCRYVYASFEPDLKVGDLVVVKPSHHDVALARVHEILEGTDHESTREVISKVCTDDYNERVKVRTQVAELKAKMQERARQLQDIALYQMLAKDDPAMQALLDEYQALKK